VGGKQPEGASPRAIAIVLALVVLAFALLAGRWLIHTRAPYAGTNSVAPKYSLPGVAAHHRLCIKDLTIPAGANDLQLRVAAAGTVATPVQLRLSAGGQTQRSRGLAPGGALGPLDFRFRPFDRDVQAAACITSSGVIASESGQPAGAAGTGFAYLDDKPAGAPSVWFLRLPARRLVSALPAAAHRASLFRAGFVGPWLYAAMAVLLVLAWAAGVRTVLRGRT
jgi:hypothetical protein